MSITLRFVTALGALASAGVAVAGPAHAEEVAAPSARDEARLRVERGRQLYERGDYQGASEAYREAYRLQPSAGVMFNLGQSYRQDGHCAEAATAYRAALRSDLASPARAVAEQQLAAVETCVRALDRTDARRDRHLRRDGLIVMAGGGAALVVATGFALADNDGHDGLGTTSVVLTVGGGLAVATGVVVYAVAQRRINRRVRTRPQPTVFQVPVGTAPVAGAAWRF